jgi:hypothetical protein
MAALAGSGVAVMNPVANSAAAANPIRTFMLESSMWDAKACSPGPLQAKEQWATGTISSYTTALR